MDSGLDLDSDVKLEPNESTKTIFTCKASSSLVSVAPEPAGPN